MDRFVIRLEFLNTLKKLSAAQPTVQACLEFAVQYADHSANDIWECILDECKKAPLNTRINLLFLIDSIFTDDNLSSPRITAIYQPLLVRDIDTLVDLVVPPQLWDSILNLGTVQRVLSSWKTKLILDRTQLSLLEHRLEQRQASLQQLPPSQRQSTATLSKSDMIQRIEQDRERHKRLRERSWILPPYSFLGSQMFGIQPQHLNPFFTTTFIESHSSPTKSITITLPTAHDIDFDQLWEETSDLNEDDTEYINDENQKSLVNTLINDD